MQKLHTQNHGNTYQTLNKTNYFTIKYHFYDDNVLYGLSLWTNLKTYIICMFIKFNNEVYVMHVLIGYTRFL